MPSPNLVQSDEESINIGNTTDVALAELAKLTAISSAVGDGLSSRLEARRNPRRLLDVSKLTAVCWCLCHRPARAR
jgi:hypothetical protein